MATEAYAIARKTNYQGLLERKAHWEIFWGDAKLILL